jgi:hypothetical protein
LNIGELCELIYSHLGTKDRIGRADIYRLLISMHRDTFKRANFYSLSETAILEPSSNWTFVLPTDFGDDLSVMAVGKDTIFASPILPVTSKNDYYGIVGTRNLGYINSFYSPTIPYAYYIGVPAEVWTNHTGIIAAGKENLRSINVFPPVDTTRYEISLMYYPVPPVTIGGITDAYESSLMKKYPDYVLYEMLFRCYTLLRDVEAAQMFKSLADEKFLEAKANEAREILTPPKTLHLVTTKFRRKPLPGPAVPQP